MTSLLYLFLLIPSVMADTCLTNAQFFGVIFGSVAATLFICGAIAMLLWICLRKNRTPAKKISSAAAYTNTMCDVEEKGCDAPPKAVNKDKMTMIESFKLKNKIDAETQKSLSTQNINEIDAKVGVHLNGEDLGELGFSIQGNMNEGIFVKTVLPKGPADQCGNILTGDRIKSLTINFDNMVYEDAVTLLSYASPYKVKLELERRLEDAPSPTSPTGSPRVHPLFRSNTLQNIHFNPSPCPPQRGGSDSTTQKHALPAVDSPLPPTPVKSPEPPMSPPQAISPEPTKSEITPDSSTHVGSGSSSEADISKLETSDDVDISSEYRDSLSEGHATGTESVASTEEISQSTLPDRVEITELITDKICPTPSSTPPKAEFCKALPPKPKKIVSRSPSPKLVSSTTRSPTPSRTEPTECVQTPQASAIPVRREPSRSRITPPSPPKAPEIAEARVSRIPKRTESIKTPVIERKLPSIPASAKALDEKKDSDVWSRLYQEKKGALRKTRESPTSSPSGLRSPQPVHKIARSPSIEKRYGTLSRERQQRLAANQEILDRQKDELRELGILQ